jgi:hypothetical protein
MRRWNLISTMAVLGCVLWIASGSAQPPVAKTGGSAGRYQLVAAELDAQIGGGDKSQHCLFLVDTQTGRVWKFQVGGMVAATNTAKPGYLPETFLPVNFGEVNTIPMGAELPAPSVLPH